MAHIATGPLPSNLSSIGTCGPCKAFTSRCTAVRDRITSRCGYGSLRNHNSIFLSFLINCRSNSFINGPFGQNCYNPYGTSSRRVRPVGRGTMKSNWYRTTFSSCDRYGTRNS